MAGQQPSRCTAHPGERAGWNCASCPRRLCLGCAASRRAGAGHVVVCRHCGAFAQPLLVRREARAYSSIVWEAFAYPFSTRGILILLASGLVFWLMKHGGMIGSLLAYGAMYSLLFLVVRTTALGQQDVPEADNVDGPGEMVAAALKGFVALVLAFVPLALYFYVRGQGLLGVGLDAEDAVRHAASTLLDPLFYLSILLGLAWAPIALVSAATHSPFLTILNPLAAARAIAILRWDYVVAAVLFWVLFVASGFVDGVAGTFPELVPVPVVAAAFAEAMKLYLPLVYARVLGLLLYARGGDLGYGVSSDYVVPALGDAVPALEEAPAPVPAARIAALELGPDAAPEPGVPLGRIVPRARPAAALAAGDESGAGLPALPTLPPEQPWAAEGADLDELAGFAPAQTARPAEAPGAGPGPTGSSAADVAHAPDPSVPAAFESVAAAPGDAELWSGDPETWDQVDLSHAQKETVRITDASVLQQIRGKGRR